MFRYFVALSECPNFIRNKTTMVDEKHGPMRLRSLCLGLESSKYVFRTFMTNFLDDFCLVFLKIFSMIYWITFG